MMLGKNYWCADSSGLQVCKSASLQVFSLQVSHTVFFLDQIFGKAKISQLCFYLIPDERCLISDEIDSVLVLL